MTVRACVFVIGCSAMSLAGALVLIKIMMM